MTGSTTGFYFYTAPIEDSRNGTGYFYMPITLLQTPSGHPQTAGGTGGTPNGQWVRARTDAEYKQCTAQAAQKQTSDVRTARIEQGVGGLILLGGIAVQSETIPAITATIREGIEAEPISGLVEATHTQMAYGVSLSAALIPGYLYIRGLVDQADAYDNYNRASIACAGPVRVF